MVCPRCECYYEYKGEVCLEEGKLTIKYAACKKSRGCLERMINDLTEQENKKQKEETTIQRKQLSFVQTDGQVYVFDLFGNRSNTA